MAEVKVPVPGSKYVTTTRGGSGYFAVILWINPGTGAGFNKEDLPPFAEPYESGIGRYDTRLEAANDAKRWAAELELDYVPAGTDV